MFIQTTSVYGVKDKNPVVINTDAIVSVTPYGYKNQDGSAVVNPNLCEVTFANGKTNRIHMAYTSLVILLQAKKESM